MRLLSMTFKHNLAIAQLVVMTLFCSVGYAQTQSSVTLYGVLDVGLIYRNVSYTDTKGVDQGATKFGMDNGTQSGNRWGLKGVEDLWGGNQVAFAIENGFNLGNGNYGQSGRQFGRQAWLGLQNNAWGNVRAGRQASVAYAYVGVAADPFVQGFAQASMASTFPTTNNVRYDNMLRYETPVLQGFQAAVGYSFATGMSTSYLDNKPVTSVSEAVYNFATQGNATALTLGAKYATGPVYVFATYDQVNPNQTLVQNATSSAKSWLLGASYDFQVLKAVAAYGQTRDGAIGGANSLDSIVNGKSVSSAGSLNNQGSLTVFGSGVNWNAYLIGLTAPVGSDGKVFASWQLATPGGNLQANDPTNTASANQNIYSLGYQFDFSKRSNLYAYASYADNYAFVAGYKSTLFGVGVRHMF